MVESARQEPEAVVAAASARLAAAPEWRREPYRVLFPVGVLLAWAGVLHWLLFAAGWSHGWYPVFHSITQIQGFMACFAVGFLLTAIPRRTGTDAPSASEMAIGIIAPVGTTVAAWFERLGLSQVFWIALLAMLVRFAARRFRARTAARRPPDSFVWIGAAFAMGLSGTVIVGLYGALELDFAWHELGQLLLLQGVFVGLVVGVGGMVLPLITCGDAPPDADPGKRGVRRWHVAAAVVLVATFAVEALGQVRLAHLGRGVLVLMLLVLAGRIWRAPRRPGAHRWLVWLAAWAIPIGYLLAAALPRSPQTGLHVVFVSGFALMALAVGLHVSLAHGGRQDLVTGTPWQVPVFGGAVLLATTSRGLVGLDPGRMRLWLGVAAAAFLLATVFWLWLIVAARLCAADSAPR